VASGMGALLKKLPPRRKPEKACRRPTRPTPWAAQNDRRFTVPRPRRGETTPESA